MPNWVYNNLTCEADNVTLQTLNEFFRVEVRRQTYDLETKKYVDEKVEVPFSFTAMRNPFGEPYYLDKDAYFNGMTENNLESWYLWNVNHWGVKWDARLVDIEGSDQCLSYYFETPWGIPEPEMFLEMSKQFPTVKFYITYEEEQGWGGEYSFQNGEKTYEEEYDIPESHADNVTRDRACNCQIWADDEDMYYDDCPKVLTTA
jgi:hypothetical protein